MKSLFRKFIYCGILGWCTEILFTAFQSFRRRDRTLMGTTSLWMFPIYGCGCLLAIPYHLLKNCSIFVRGLTYTFCIFTGEYISGTFLTRFHICPWDYSKSPFHIGKVIRLDYAPGWFLLGLLIEKVNAKS